MWLLRTGGCFKKVIVKAGLTVPWTKIIMRGELLVISALSAESTWPISCHFVTKTLKFYETEVWNSLPHETETVENLEM